MEEFFLPNSLFSYLCSQTKTSSFPQSQASQPLDSVQFSSVAQSCLTLCNPINHSTPGLPVHHQIPEFTQTHVHRVGDAIQPSHPLSFPSSPAPKSLPASEYFPMNQLFAWGGQSSGVSALASVLPMNYSAIHSYIKWLSFFMKYSNHQVPAGAWFQDPLRMLKSTDGQIPYMCNVM